MKQTIGAALAAGFLLLGAAWPSPAAAQGFCNDGPLGADASFYDVWIRHRLSAGLTLSCSTLTRGHVSSSHAFLGNITDLELDNTFTLVPEVKYDIADHVRLCLSYSVLKVGTENWNNHLGDGSAHFAGPLVRLDYSHPLYGYRLFPHAGLGLVFYRSSFDEDTSWKNGYANYDDWRAHGFPTRTAFGKYRTIDVDDILAPLLAAGVSYRFHPNWEVDATLRYVFAEADCTFGYVNGKGRYGVERTGQFNVDNFGLAVTLSYVF